jgi:hypothetical protein
MGCRRITSPHPESIVGKISSGDEICIRGASRLKETGWHAAGIGRGIGKDGTAAKLSHRIR